MRNGKRAERLPEGLRLPQVGLIVGIDMTLGPAGELHGMHTVLAGIGLTLPQRTAERVAVKIQRVIESELFEAESPIEIRAGRG